MKINDQPKLISSCLGRFVESRLHKSLRHLVGTQGAGILAFGLVVVGPALSVQTLFVQPLFAQPTEKSPIEAPPTIQKATEGMQQHEGFMSFFVDAVGGRILLDLPAPGADSVVAEAIYVEGLRQGLGSNPVGLDRGQLGEAKHVRIRRIGPKVLIEQPNARYRAQGAPEAEVRAARESFATSVLWGGTIVALDPDGRTLVDLTTFLLRDAHGVARTLAETDQGAFTLDSERSAVLLDDCLAFPDNIELESVLTWAGDKPGPLVAETAPTPEAVSLIAHQSFVRLPDDGYQPRVLDPRMGMFGIEFIDYATALDQPIRRRLISRHRLEKVDAKAARSRVVEPIVYYVDRGAPEPVRSALVEGASWWASAFEDAGFIDGFRVELMPEGAHPLDVRYNVIQWVHRSTRGWSYGGGVIDPRTGEIIKGHVTLGSLRVRQDRLLFEGLAGTAKTGSGAADDPVELALARIRQLSAHEVGHTLGITHNFAASTYSGRASVMDYPAPLVSIGTNGELDFSKAYGVGIGAWDAHTIRYGYGQPVAGNDEAGFLADVVRDGIANGLLFLTDQDARPPSASDARGNLWDNGDDAVSALEEVLAVRAHALGRFGATNIRVGQPLAALEQVLMPLYFHHRYQLDATAKMIGGLEYHYAVRGDGQVPTRPVSAARQRQALDAVLAVLEPAVLDIPDGVLELLAPLPFGWNRSVESFDGRTWPAFDALGAASTIADQVIALITEPARIGRLIELNRRSPAMPSAEEVVQALVDASFGSPGEGPRAAALRGAVREALVTRLIARASEPSTSMGVRAHYEAALRGVESRLSALPTPDDGGHDAIHSRSLRSAIARFEARQGTAPSDPVGAPDPPPGSPIGAGTVSQSLHTRSMPEALGSCQHDPWTMR